MIPAMNDHELESILAAAAKAGATSAGYTLIRLPWELKELCEDWLEAHFPDRRDKVLNQIRRHHGGNLYDSAWSDRMSDKGPEAELLRSGFELACRRLRLESRRWDLGSVHFCASSYRCSRISSIYERSVSVDLAIPCGSARDDQDGGSEGIGTGLPPYMAHPLGPLPGGQEPGQCSGTSCRATPVLRGRRAGAAGHSFVACPAEVSNTGLMN
jgi:hypothetical protein